MLGDVPTELLDGSPGFQAQKKILVPQTQMPRVGDMWPSWFSLGRSEPLRGRNARWRIARTDPGVPGVRNPPPPGSAVGRNSQPAADRDPVDELQALAKMKADGLLTDDEFTAAKAKLLRDD